MKQIRQGVFETNSSSMHSLCIQRDEPDEVEISYLHEEDGYITTQIGEFGWGIETLRQQEEKLSYILTMIMMKEGFYPIESKEDEKLFEESRLFGLLKEVVEEHSGCKLRVRYTLEDDDEEYVWGYVDHQSQDTLDRELLGDDKTVKENIKKIIFSYRYFIVIDNDNH